MLVGFPWAEHVCFLDSPETMETNHRLVREGVRGVAGHRAIFAYLIGNEIPPDIVRWYGPERVRDFLRVLADDVRELDPDALVSYANFPPTEYLDLDFLDFVCFNVYLHHEADFRRYLARLQNIAEDKPLVLTEFGIDSIREGAKRQAEMLSWQIRAAFEAGVAGTFVFSWTDDWFTGGSRSTTGRSAWSRASASAKPAFHAVRALYAAPLPPPLRDPPKVSVVICAYNAERTMDACLQSLAAAALPELRGHRRQRRLDRRAPLGDRAALPASTSSTRRTRGSRSRATSASRPPAGEIVAYTDSDCVVDPDWLTYLSSPWFGTGFVAVGGPNFPPPEDRASPACVAASPGGPTHVLLNDEVAEHIPGCNMAFRRSALREVGGFEPIFTAAGDDVDLCWRLQNRGHAIGFSPAAMVWHFRRNTVKAYLKQQRGYGKAEALLYFKHPYRFNMLGQSRWLGRIYGDSPSGLLSRRPGHLLRHLRPRALPDALRAAVVAVRVSAVHARVGTWYRCSSDRLRHRCPVATCCRSSSRWRSRWAVGRDARRYRKLDPRYDDLAAGCWSPCSSTSARCCAATSATSGGCVGSPTSSASASRSRGSDPRRWSRTRVLVSLLERAGGREGRACSRGSWTS